MEHRETKKIESDDVAPPGLSIALIYVWTRARAHTYIMVFPIGKLRFLSNPEVGRTYIWCPKSILKMLKFWMVLELSRTFLISSRPMSEPCYRPTSQNLIENILLLFWHLFAESTTSFLLCSLSTSSFYWQFEILFTPIKLLIDGPLVVGLFSQQITINKAISLPL